MRTNPAIVTKFGVSKNDPETEDEHRSVDGVSHQAEYAALHQLGRLARVDADAPGVAHVELRPDRQGDATDRHDDSRDQNPLGISERPDDCAVLQRWSDDRDDQRYGKANAGNPFHRADPAVDAPKAGRPGAPVLQPSAPAESEHAEHRE
ncbi:MAG: hypothetical protein WA248_27525 [Mycobacterium sp.]